MIIHYQNPGLALGLETPFLREIAPKRNCQTPVIRFIIIPNLIATSNSTDVNTHVQIQLTQHPRAASFWNFRGFTHTGLRQVQPTHTQQLWAIRRKYNHILRQKESSRTPCSTNIQIRTSDLLRDTNFHPASMCGVTQNFPRSRIKEIRLFKLVLTSMVPLVKWQSMRSVKRRSQKFPQR